jgi:zinc protease
LAGAGRKRIVPSWSGISGGPFVWSERTEHKELLMYLALRESCRRTAAGTLALFLSVAVLAPTVSAQTPVNVRIPLQRYQLANGLDVVLLEDHAAPIIYVDVTYRVGSGNETVGKSGFAHLFEHMMFQGSQHVGEDRHFAILAAAGARGVNGTTNTDRTNYFESLPANQLETALWLESDRMGYLLPVLTQKALDNQRDVVLNERRMSYENVAYGPERFAIALELYPEGHPYRHLTIGLTEDVQNATLEEVRAFFARWYVPSNATLLVGGDIDVATTRALVDKWFGTFPRGAKPMVVRPTPPVLVDTRRKVVNDGLASVRRIHYVWPTPATFQPGDAELDLLAGVLLSTTGRLRKTLVVDRAIATSISGGQQSRSFSSEFHVVVDLRPDASLEGAEALIQAELARLTSEPVQPRELRQAVARFQSGASFALEPLAARGQRLQYYAVHGGNPDFIGSDLERYRSASVDALRATAQKYLTNKRIEIITMPGASPSP